MRPGAATAWCSTSSATRVAAAVAVSAVVDRPRHAALAAFVVGLLCGPRLGLLGVVLVTLAGLGTAFTLLRWRSTPPGPQSGPDDLDASGARAGAGASVAPVADRASRLLRLGAAVGLFAIVGAGVGAARVTALEASDLGSLLGREVNERVTVQEAPRTSRFGGWSALVRLRGEPVLLRVVDRAAAAAGAVASTDLPEPGAIIAVTGRLRPPGDFAYARHAHAELSAAAARPVGRRGGVLGALDGARRLAERALDRGLPADAAGLLRGMVLGQDGALPTPTRDAFRAAGLSHLVAASGTNVVLLAALATALGSALGLGLTGRLWLVLALIAMYVPLAGGGPSIQRAGVMGAAAVAAGLVGRPASRWWGLGLAAATTLTLDPRAVEDPGWQLSFVAVLAILLVAGRWRELLTRRGVPRTLAELAAMTAAATVATAPLVAAHFGQASLVGLPVNLLAAPAVAPVMWLGVAAASVGQVAALGGVAATCSGAVADGLDALAGFPLGYLTWLARTGAAFPGGVVQVGPWVVLIACGSVLGVVGSRRVRRLTPLLALGCAALVLGLDPARGGPPEAPGGLRVTLLDVGQGDATLLQDGARAVLVDAGPPEADVVALLRRSGVRRLDVLVVTHAQADHLGGAAAVVTSLPVGMVLDGRDGVSSPGGDAMASVARARRIPLVAGRAGQVLRLGGLRLRVLWPPAQAPAALGGADPNDRAIVLEADARGARVLLTADAESDVLSRLELRPVDVLKVSHHGSQDPGLPTLLARLRPRIAAIEVGAHNTYGHPAPSTLAALGQVPAVVRTDRDGTVRLDADDAGAWEIRADA